jgi:hypothetical protein
VRDGWSRRDKLHYFPQNHRAGSARDCDCSASELTTTVSQCVCVCNSEKAICTDLFSDVTNMTQHRFPSE